MCRCVAMCMARSMRIFGGGFCAVVLLSLTATGGVTDPQDGYLFKSIFTSSNDRIYPEFGIGPTGIGATISNLVVTVQQTYSGSPASGVLQAGDIITDVNGISVSGEPDPRVVLGVQIGLAEGSDGHLDFDILRGGSPMTQRVTLPVLGSYSASWPLDCPKSSNIVDQVAAHIINGGYLSSTGLDNLLAGLFLLSTGDDQYLDEVKSQVDRIGSSGGGSAWGNGYAGLLLTEYYLRTGDASALPKIQGYVDTSAAGAVNGCMWGHGSIPNGTGSGYVQGGIMNQPGTVVLMMMTLARECGVTDSLGVWEKSVKYNFRFAGHGSVPYGDHYGEVWMSCNGKEGAAACLWSLMDASPFQEASEYVGLTMADSYYAALEAGHTGGGFDVIWRGLGAVHTPASKNARYRACMDNLAWYYDMCRNHDGGFRMMPTGTGTRYTGASWGIGAAMAYTAARGKLRITGGAPTVHSTAYTAPTITWGNTRDLEILSTDHISDYGVDDLAQDAIWDKIENPDPEPASYFGRLMRHNNGILRTRAARVLARRADAAALAELATALQHSDMRTRQAALQGVGGFDNWGTMDNTAIPSTTVSTQLMPYIQAILNDSNAALWEIHGALLALAKAEPGDIRANRVLIEQYLEHDDWWLRDAAFQALAALGGEITGEEFILMAKVCGSEDHVYARAQHDGGFTYVLKTEGALISAVDMQVAAGFLGRVISNPTPLEGYDQDAARHTEIFRTMMILDSFPSDVLNSMIADVALYFDEWELKYTDQQHTGWLFQESPPFTDRGWPWYVMNMGAAGEWLVHAIKTMQAQIKTAIDGGDNRSTLLEMQTLVTSVVTTYEATYGTVPWPGLAPIAVAAPDYVVVDEDGDGLETVLLNGAQSGDPDGLLLDYMWEQGDGVYLGHGAELSVTAPRGTNTFVLYVADEQGRVGSDSFQVEVVSGFNSNKPVKVFILAGQSNMEGKGWIEHLEPPLADPRKRGPYLHTQDDFGTWATPEDVWVHYFNENVWGDLGPGYATPRTVAGYDPHSMGVEYQFGHVMREAFDSQVLLIKCAWGGASLAVDFRPPSRGGPGPNYIRMTNDVDRILNDLDTYFPGYEGQGYEMAGFVWFQGFNDMLNADYTAAYDTNLVAFIQDVRAEWGANLPFVVGELGHNGTNPSAGTATFRAKQLSATQMEPNKTAFALTHPYWHYEAAAMYAADSDCWKEGNPLRDQFYAMAGDRPYHYMGAGETFFWMGDSMGRGMNTLCGVPTADAGADRVLQEDSLGIGYATVSLDGSGSSDPDGTIVSYMWRLSGDRVIGSGSSEIVTLPVGPHWVSLTVMDEAGQAATVHALLEVTCRVDGPPATPSDFAAVAADGSVSLDWSANLDPDLAGYNVYRSREVSGPFELLVGGLSQDAYLDDTVVNGTRYWYVLTAEDESGNLSVPTDVVGVTPAAAPAALFASKLRAYWNFDEFYPAEPPLDMGLPSPSMSKTGTRGEFLDMSGRGNTAYAANYITFAQPYDATGKLGGCFYSETPVGVGAGVGCAAVAVPNADLNFSQQDFTVLFWEKVGYRLDPPVDNTWPPGAGRSLMFAKAPSMIGQAGQKGYGLKCTQTTLTLNANSDNNYIQEAFASMPHESWDSGQWAHMALVGNYNGVADSYAMQLYVNGVHQPAMDAAVSNDVIDNNGFMTVGAFYRDGAFAWQHWLSFNMYAPGTTNGQGWIDDFGMLEHACSALEVEVILGFADHPDMGYDLGTILRIFDVHLAASGAMVADGVEWTYATGLTGPEGVISGDASNGYALVLDAAADTGVIGQSTGIVPPSGLSAVAGDGQVSLDWDDTANPDFAKYKLYRAPSDQGPFVELAGNLLVSSYLDESVVNGGPCYYYVQLVTTANGSSAASAMVSATPVDVTPPAPPTGLSGVSSDTVVSIDWDDSEATDFDRYSVHRATTMGGPYTTLFTNAAMSQYVDDGLVNGTTYYYVITARDVLGNESAYSAEMVIRPVDPGAPAAPGGLVAVAEGGTVSLNWSNNTEPDFEDYTVYRSSSHGSGYSVLAAGLSTSDYVDNTVVNGTRYYYVVSAFNTSSNESDNSLEVTAMPGSEEDWYILPFEETFDLLAPGTLNGQHGWVAEGVEVQADVTYGGSAKACAGTDAGGYLRHTFSDARTRVWTDMRLQIVHALEPPVPAAGTTVAGYVSTNSQVMVFDGKNAVSSGLIAAKGEWVHLAIFSDYTTETWYLCVGGQQAGPFSFFDSNPSGYRELMLGASSFVDDLLITESALYTLYAPGGKITPLEWVRNYNGGDPTLSDQDRDALTLDQEYLIESNPTISNKFEIIALGFTPGNTPYPYPYLQYNANGLPNGKLSVSNSTDLVAGSWGELLGTLSLPTSNVVQWTGDDPAGTNGIMRIYVTE